MNGQVKMNPKSPLNLGAWRSEMISVISSATVLIRKIKCRRLSGLSGVPTWARSCTKWSAGIQTENITTDIYTICAPKLNQVIITLSMWMSGGPSPATEAVPREESPTGWRVPGARPLPLLLSSHYKLLQFKCARFSGFADYIT